MEKIKFPDVSLSSLGQKDRTFIYNAKGRNAPKFFHELQFDGVCYVSPRRFTKADIPA